MIKVGDDCENKETNLQAPQVSNCRQPLRGVKICLTGISSNEERKFKQCISTLGGIFSNNLTKDSSCLLVKKVGSKKYQAALDLNIPVLQLEWLNDCFSTFSMLPMDAYRAKPFTGLAFSSTGYSVEDRSAIQHLIAENGGINCEKMAQDICTHLIALTSGSDKYKAAKQWKTVQVVSRRWLDDCVSKNRWLSEVPYQVLPEHKRPPDQLKEMNEKRAAALMKISEHVTKSKANASPSLHANVVELSQLPSISKIPEKTLHTALRGEVFYITGFNKETQDALVRLVLAGGGSRHMLLTTVVTKIMLGPDTDPRLRREARAHPLGAECVLVSWVTDALFNPNNNLPKHLSALEPLHTDKSKQESAGDDLTHETIAARNISNKSAIISDKIAVGIIKDNNTTNSVQLQKRQRSSSFGLRVPHLNKLHHTSSSSKHEHKDSSFGLSASSAVPPILSSPKSINFPLPRPVRKRLLHTHHEEDTEIQSQLAGIVPPVPDSSNSNSSALTATGTHLVINSIINDKKKNWSVYEESQIVTFGI